MFSQLAHFVEKHPSIHRSSLAVWRLFPPRIAGFLKGLLTRNWLVGAVAVMIDEDSSPPQVLLVQHSYRPKGAWGLPGGALDSIDGNPTKPRNDASPDDVIEEALRREVWEELGIEIEVLRLIKVDAVPFVAEEPGPYRLDFYYRCKPSNGFGTLAAGLRSGDIKSPSPEIMQIRLVPCTELINYDLYSSDARFLRDDVPRLEAALFESKYGRYSSRNMIDKNR
jgi:8-oxo-dGTP pyrophosphatase MutT (NUDIX family)